MRLKAAASKDGVRRAVFYRNQAVRVYVVVVEPGGVG